MRNSLATLTFTLWRNSLSDDDQIAVLQAFQAGNVTIAVKGDAEGAAYQSFDVCLPDQIAADGCAEVRGYDTVFRTCSA